MDEEYAATEDDLALTKDDARFQIETVQGGRRIVYHYTRAELEDMLEHYGETDEVLIRLRSDNEV